jgi:hypothetical protein
LNRCEDQAACASRLTRCSYSSACGEAPSESSIAE